MPICDDAYWNASGLREDKLGYVALDLPAGESLTFTLTGYTHQNEGQGLWGTPYVPTPGGAPLSVRTTEYDIDRQGAHCRRHVDARRPRDQRAASGTRTTTSTRRAASTPEPNVAAPTRDFTEFLSNPLLTQWEYAFETDTLLFHLQDTWQVSDALRVNFGFKSMDVENDRATIVGDNKSGTIDVERRLPAAGRLQLVPVDNNEIFGRPRRTCGRSSVRTPPAPSAPAQAGFNAIRDTLEPETSTTFELGWRFRGERFEGSLAAYHVKFDDRLLAIQQGAGIIGNPSVLANVGSVTTNGLEARACLAAD